MNNFTKLVVLFLAFLLSFSNGKEASGEVLLPEVHAGVEFSSPSYLSENKLSKIFCLHQSGEIVVNTVNHLPAPGSKIFKDYFSGGIFSFEGRVHTLASRYVKHAKEINRSLTIRDIIFPFHFFW